MARRIIPDAETVEQFDAAFGAGSWICHGLRFAAEVDYPLDSAEKNVARYLRWLGEFAWIFDDLPPLRPVSAEQRQVLLQQQARYDEEDLLEELADYDSVEEWEESESRQREWEEADGIRKATERQELMKGLWDEPCGRPFRPREEQ